MPVLSLPVLLATPLLIPVQASHCDKRKRFRTEINYELVVNPTKKLNYMSREYMTRQGEQRLKEWVQRHKGHAWISSMGGNPNMHVNGTNTGHLNIESSFRFIAYPYDKYGAYYCPYVRSMDVRVIYHSEISIAREIKKGTCKYKAVMEHEMRHHDTNVTVAETLMKRMEADTPAIIDMLERYYVQAEKIDARYEDMKQGIREALDIYGAEMYARKDEFNAYVDSPEEYKRVSEMCPGE